MGDVIVVGAAHLRCASGATMTCMLGGRQYLVVATGGGNVTAELPAFRLLRA